MGCEEIKAKIGAVLRVVCITNCWEKLERVVRRFPGLITHTHDRTTMPLNHSTAAHTHTLHHLCIDLR